MLKPRWKTTGERQTWWPNNACRTRRSDLDRLRIGTMPSPRVRRWKSCRTRCATRKVSERQLFGHNTSPVAPSTGTASTQTARKIIIWHDSVRSLPRMATSPHCPQNPSGRGFGRKRCLQQRASMAAGDIALEASGFGTTHRQRIQFIALLISPGLLESRPLVRLVPSRGLS